jgi:hypothetical protein
VPHLRIGKDNPKVPHVRACVLGLGFVSLQPAWMRASIVVVWMRPASNDNFRAACTSLFPLSYGNCRKRVIFCRICAFVSASIRFNHTTASGMTPMAATGIRSRGATMHYIHHTAGRNGTHIACVHPLDTTHPPDGAAAHLLGRPEPNLPHVQCPRLRAFDTC